MSKESCPRKSEKYGLKVEPLHSKQVNAGRNKYTPSAEQHEKQRKRK